MLDLVIGAWLYTLAITCSLLLVVVVARGVARRLRGVVRAVGRAGSGVSEAPADAPLLASSGARAA